MKRVVACFRARLCSASSTIWLVADCKGENFVRRVFGKGLGEPEAYLVIIDHNNHGRVGMYFLDGVEVPQRIDRDEGPILAHAGAGPPGSDVLAHVRQFVQTGRSPCAHEFVFVVVGRDVRAGAFLPREGEGWFLALAEEGRREIAVGVGSEGLAEAALLGRVERTSIGNDAFGAGVGDERGGAWDVVGGRRHVGDFIARLAGGERGAFVV